MIGLIGKYAEPGNQVARSEMRPRTVRKIRHHTDNAIFCDWALAHPDFALAAHQ